MIIGTQSRISYFHLIRHTRKQLHRLFRSPIKRPKMLLRTILSKLTLLKGEAGNVSTHITTTNRTKLVVPLPPVSSARNNRNGNHYSEYIFYICTSWQMTAPNVLDLLHLNMCKSRCDRPLFQTACSISQ